MRPEDVGLSRDLQFFKPKEVVDGNTRVTYTTIYKCENFSVSFPIFSFIKKRLTLNEKEFLYICVRFISWWDYMMPKAISERDFELSFLVWFGIITLTFWMLADQRLYLLSSVVHFLSPCNCSHTSTQPSRNDCIQQASNGDNAH